jgi:hypothetical protein
MNVLADVIVRRRSEIPLSDQLPTLDPPVHTRHRALLNKMFTPNRLKENEQFMWALAEQRIDASRPSCSPPGRRPRRADLHRDARARRSPFSPMSSARTRGRFRTSSRNAFASRARSRAPSGWRCATPASPVSTFRPDRCSWP